MAVQELKLGVANHPAKPWTLPFRNGLRPVIRHLSAPWFICLIRNDTDM